MRYRTRAGNSIRHRNVESFEANKKKATAMSEVCKACGYKFKHEYEYRNTETDIVLCQNCSLKIAKHVISGLTAMAEAEAHLGQQAVTFLSRVEKRFKRND